MTYRIGLGILLPDVIYNHIRAVELDIMDKTSNQRGLTQPPNITVKRPFELSSKTELNSFLKLLDSVNCEMVGTTSYESIGFFENGFMHLKVSENSLLNTLHSNLLKLCTNFHIKPDEFEAENVIFHTTLAMNLTYEQVRQFAATLKNLPSNIRTFVPCQLGVFTWLS